MLKEGAVEQARLAVMGVVFFLGAAILLDLAFVAATPDYWFHQHPSNGVAVLVLDALNLAAAYGSWQTKMWGYIVAILLCEGHRMVVDQGTI